MVRRITKNSGCSDFVTTAIILRSRSASTSSGETMIWSFWRRSFASKNLRLVARCDRRPCDDRPSCWSRMEARSARNLLQGFLLRGTEQLEDDRMDPCGRAEKEELRPVTYGAARWEEDQSHTASRKHR